MITPSTGGSPPGGAVVSTSHPQRAHRAATAKTRANMAGQASTGAYGLSATRLARIGRPAPSARRLAQVGSRRRVSWRSAPRPALWVRPCPPRFPDGFLPALRQRLEAHYGDRLVRAVLFGSYARGEATEESDVDVLVVLGGARWTRGRRGSHSPRSPSTSCSSLARALSIVVVDKAHLYERNWSFIQNVQRGCHARSPRHDGLYDGAAASSPRPRTRRLDDVARRDRDAHGFPRHAASRAPTTPSSTRASAALSEARESAQSLTQASDGSVQPRACS